MTTGRINQITIIVPSQPPPFSLSLSSKKERKREEKREANPETTVHT
jgi:hypothetical protein